MSSGRLFMWVGGSAIQQRINHVCYIAFGLLLCLISMPAVMASDTPTFSPTVHLDDVPSSPLLTLSGHAVRKQFFLRIYTLAHYMAWPEVAIDAYAASSSTALSNAVTQALSGQYLQQIDIVFARDLRAEQIKHALVDGIKRNSTYDQYRQIESSLAAFKQGITQDVEKGAHFRLRWQPDGRLLAMYESQVVIDIVDPLFARLLWSVWFGERAVIDRRELLSRRVQTLAEK